MEKVLNNEYIFDYNIVAQLDPDYKKYLVDIKGLREESVQVDACCDDVPAQDSGTEEQDNDVDAVISLVHGSRDRYSENSIMDMQLTGTAEIEGPMYILRQKYMHHKRPTKVNPLQLMPPTNVLAVYSKVWTGENLCYKINKGRYRDPNQVDAARTRLRRVDGRIRLMKSSYWFDRKKNVMSERKELLRCLVYNTRTRLLYFWKWEHKKTKRGRRRFYRTVRTILFDKATLDQTLICNDTFGYKFVKMLSEAVRKDVPDAFVPELTDPADLNKRSTNPIDSGPKKLGQNVFSYATILLMLQHRIGQRIDWLDRSSFEVICGASADSHFDTRFTGNIDGSCENIVNARKSRRKRISKIVPSLRKHNNFTSLVRAMYGDHYKKILLKLLPSGLVAYRVHSVLELINKDTMPKVLYHWMVGVLGDPYLSNKESILRSIVNTSIGIPVQSPVDIALISSWVKISKRFLLGGSELSWHTWRDMHRMARELNIRIRPGKFANADDVQALHDKISDIRNRDKCVLREFANTEFEPFAHPDKEYDGFRFEFLNSAEKLIDEGTKMHHCVGGYANPCSQGACIIFSMRKGSTGYVTIEVTGSDKQYRIVQQYTISDYTVKNDEILATIQDWQKDLTEIHKDDDVTYYDTCQKKIMAVQAAAVPDNNEDSVSGVLSAAPSRAMQEVLA